MSEPTEDQTPEDQTDVDSALRKLTGLVATALSEVSSRLERLEREASVCPGGGIPIPPELVIGDRARQVLGYRNTGGAEQTKGYRGFEDVFRGSEAEIEQRLRFYLPHLRGQGPVLDIGCGRGEMLEVLSGAGIEVLGVDSDPTMAARATAKGHHVVEADALEFLGAQVAGSAGAVFSAQFIEHLSTEGVATFLEQARRVLASGGAFIAETVNPHCAIARKNFWLDLTHQHPVFPEVALVLCRTAGFQEATIVFPTGSGVLADDLLRAPDYAVVATR